MSVSASQVTIGPLTLEYSDEHSELYLVVDETVQASVELVQDDWDDFVEALSREAIEVD